ncbi:MAG: hypothetical protein AB1416_06945 [Actinomycetota bacterium]
MRDALSAEPLLAAGLVEPAPEPVITPLVCPPLSRQEAIGLDLILEGFLLHHGRPRQLAIEEPGRRVLAGDYCYAQGLVQVAASGDLVVIEALADLIALSAAAADGRRSALAPLWAGTVAAIRARRAGDDDDGVAIALSAAKRALRVDGDPEPLAALAGGLPHVTRFAEVLAP